MLGYYRIIHPNLQTLFLGFWEFQGNLTLCNSFVISCAVQLACNLQWFYSAYCTLTCYFNRLCTPPGHTEVPPSSLVHSSYWFWNMAHDWEITESVVWQTQKSVMTQLWTSLTCLWPTYETWPISHLAPWTPDTLIFPWLQRHFRPTDTNMPADSPFQVTDQLILNKRHPHGQAVTWRCAHGTPGLPTGPPTQWELITT